MRTRLGSLALALVLLSACAPTVYVTYQTDPEAATIYQGATSFGAAPVQLTYHPTFGKQACVTLQPVAAQWVSGARAEVPGLSLCQANGRNQQFVFQRPTGWPNVAVDASFAATIANGRADAAARPIYIPQLAYIPPPPPPQHCTSTVIGNQIFTNCY